jgi:pilus assembly protein CpaB
LVNRQNLLRSFLLAAIFSASAYIGLAKWISSADREVETADTLPILIANRYVPAFSLVRSEAVSMKTFPPGFVPPGALHSANELVDSKGRPLYISPLPLPAGQPLTRAALVEVEKSRGMASLLPPGKVAASFAADRVRGVGGWIQPGDRIAVYQSRESGQVRMLFPAVLVLAVDKTSLREPVQLDETKDTVSFLETPAEAGAVLTVLLNTFEAEPFIEAQEHGHLTAAIRAIGDELMEGPHGS